MMLRKITNKWSPLPFAFLTEKKTIGIYSNSQFVDLLRHERLRADRNNTMFSLVLYETSSANEKNRLAHRFNKIKKDIREIDFIGWFDSGTIGVILPETDYKGALHFSSHFKKNLQGISFTEKIQLYPEGSGGRKEWKIDFSAPVPKWKILLDRTGSVAGFLLFSPIFLLLPLYIKIVSPGPVFYSQIRIGYKGKEFRFWKFRTMHVNTGTSSHNDHLKHLINSDVPMTKLDESEDPRIIPGGRVIRKACLDELPQIYNIFKGDMSLVGPRPCIPYEAEEFRRWHKYRFDINPGLTGLWQVSGKNKLTFKEMIRLDITYARNMSLLLDLRIIWATIPAIGKIVWEAILCRLSHEQSEEDMKHGKAV